MDQLDPASVLPYEVFLLVLAFCGARSVRSSTSRVSRAWRRASLDGALWRLFCTETRTFANTPNCERLYLKNAADLPPLPDLGMWRAVHTQLGMFDRELLTNVLASSGHASSSLDYHAGDQEQQDVDQTLSESERTFWSSAGSADAQSCEWLEYRLVSPCIIGAVSFVPYCASFQPGLPVYSPQHWRVHVGFQSGAWHFSSALMPAQERDTPHTITLAPPRLVCGSVVRIDLLGRTRKQAQDDLFYTCVRTTRITGLPLACWAPRAPTLCAALAQAAGCTLAELVADPASELLRTQATATASALRRLAAALKGDRPRDALPQLVSERASAVAPDFGDRLLAVLRADAPRLEAEYLRALLYLPARTPLALSPGEAVAAVLALVGDSPTDEAGLAQLQHSIMAYLQRGRLPLCEAVADALCAANVHIVALHIYHECHIMEKAFAALVGAGRASPAELTDFAEYMDDAECALSMCVQLVGNAGRVALGALALVRAGVLAPERACAVLSMPAADADDASATQRLQAHAARLAAARELSPAIRAWIDGS